MLQDVRFGLRGLRLNPGFTALAALTLAVGLGACLASFSIVNGILLRPLPYPQPERVVSIWEVGKEGTESPVAFPNFEDWHSQARGFEAMAAYAGGETPVLIGREAVRADAYVATEDFFRVLGVEPLIGRGFRPADAHAASVAVVSHGFWLNVLGAPADLSSQTITVDEDVCELVGVMPPDFAYPAAADVWVANTVRRQWGSRTAHNVQVIGRLRPDVPFAAAQEEMHVIAARLKATYPDNDAFSARLIDLRDMLVTNTRKPLYLLMGAVLLILLTACANLASTLLARATRRQREMAIRASLGADRGRLVRQLLAESLVLAAIGGAGGLLVARLLMPILVGLAPTSLPRAGEIHVDGLVTLVALGLSLVTSVLVGLPPALHASRVDLGTALADTSRGATAQHSSRARATLVAAEVAVAFVLLVGAGLLIKSFAAVLSQPLGFNPSNVLTVNIALPGATYGGAGRQPQVVAFHDRLLEATRALRGVETVGLTTSLPLARAPNGKFAVADSTEPFGDAIYRVVDADLFKTLQIPLVAGRLFDTTDRESDAVHAAIVNKTLADRFWPGQTPVGKRVRPLGMDRYGPTWLTVVGVVGDTKAGSLTRQPYPEIFVYYRQRPQRVRYATLVVRTAGEPGAQAPAIRELVKMLEPGVPPQFLTFDARIATMADVANRAFLMRLLTAFGGLALLLTAAGIYAVLAYAVAQRTREIGIRLALGATRRAVIVLIFRHAFASVAAGAMVGLLGASLLANTLRTVLFDVGPADPLVLAGVCLLIAGTTGLAGYVPAWRATRVDPQVAMRSE
jgi:putative ABC transport system permease protein